MNINLNPNSELNQSIVNVPDVVQVPDVWINEARQKLPGMKVKEKFSFEWQ